MNGKLDTRAYRRKLFVVAGGFAIATAFESIGHDGKAIAGRRWQTGPFKNNLWDIFTGKALPGRYRALLFVYGPNMATNSTAADFGTAITLFQDNPYRLPPSLANAAAGPGKHLQLFVYEYERKTLGDDAVRVTHLSPEAHLAGAGLNAIVNGACP
ncbi:hypothetical protein [Sphingomonas sp. LT1P40]|uniref:hypothetical protein n=1 Tax=Alteristakelama amylovorans TaxID=3096166 RepID=UPI002FC700B9